MLYCLSAKSTLSAGKNQRLQGEINPNYLRPTSISTWPSFDNLKTTLAYFEISMESASPIFITSRACVPGSFFYILYNHAKCQKEMGHPIQTNK
jgi:hypothetical protein